MQGFFIPILAKRADPALKGCKDNAIVASLENVPIYLLQTPVLLIRSGNRGSLGILFA